MTNKCTLQIYINIIIYKNKHKLKKRREMRKSKSNGHAMYT